MAALGGYQIVSEEEWSQFAPRREDWDTIMDELLAGKIVEVHYETGKRKSTSLSLVQVARHRGFHLDIKGQDGRLLIRRRAEKPRRIAEEEKIAV